MYWKTIRTQDNNYSYNPDSKDIADIYPILHISCIHKDKNKNILLHRIGNLKTIILHFKNLEDRNLVFEFISNGNHNYKGPMYTHYGYNTEEYKKEIQYIKGDSI